MSGIEAIREKWLEIGLATGSCDHAAVERAVGEVHARLGREAPSEYVWRGSPFAGWLLAAALGARSEWGDTGARFRDRMRLEAMSHVPFAKWVGLSDALSAPLGQSIVRRVLQPLRAGLYDAARRPEDRRSEYPPLERVRAEMALVVRANSTPTGNDQWLSIASGRTELLEMAGYGQFDADWIAFYDYLASVEGLSLPGVDCFAALARAGWWWPLGRTTILTERPTGLKRDAEGRLHCESGPALSYADGFAIWAWHGLRVPSWIILGKFDAAAVDRQSNIEVRRIMIERYGPGKYLMESGAELVHADAFGELYRKDLVDDEPIVMVRVRNSTPEPDGSRKEYFLRVPPSVSTAHEAVAWTFALKRSEYWPVEET